MDIAVFYSDAHSKSEVDQFSQKLELFLMGKANIKRARYKDHKSLVNEPAILLFHEEEVDEVEIIVGERNAKLIIAINGPKEIRHIKDFHHVADRIYGFIDFSQDDLYNIPLLSNYLQHELSLDQGKLANLSNDLSIILAQTMKELDRVKKIHHEVVPMREFKGKGVHSTLKFLSGEKPGGEFFDSKITEGTQWFFYVRSHSYLISSLLISEVERIKNESDVSTHLKAFFKVVNELQTQHKTEVECLVSALDMKHLTLDIWNQSSAEIYYDGEIVLREQIKAVQSSDVNEQKIRLKPEGTMVFISSGLRQVFQTSITDMTLDQFVKENYKLGEREFLNELFLKIKSKNIGMFLPYDSLACVTHVDGNALFQIN